MANTVRTQIAQLLSSHRRRVIYAAILSLVALFVAYEVVLHLRQRGFAKVREVRILECPYEGNGAHTHDSSCYDEEGSLVCPLEERELHVHDDSCYTEEQVLVCGMEESEGHTHTEECYDEEGNLACGLEESEGHLHTDGCYETVRTLTCGKGEVTEAHVHGPGCFKTILVDDGEEEEDTASEASGEQIFTEDLSEQDVFSNEQLALSVMVKAPVGALPPESSVAVTPLEGDQILRGWDGVDDLLRRELGDDVAVRRVVSARLELIDAQGKRVAPVGNVQVRTWADFVLDARELVVVRLVAEGDPEQLEPELMGDAWLVSWDEQNQASGAEDALQFWMDRPVMAFAIVELGAAPAPDEPVEQQEEQQVEQPEEQQVEEQQPEDEREDQQPEQSADQQEEQVAEQPEEQQESGDPEQAEQPDDQQEGQQTEDQQVEQPDGQQEGQESEQPAEEQEGQQTEEDEGQQDEQQPSGPQLIEVIVDFVSSAYPEQDFEGHAGNVTVTVKAPEGAFPAGTTMQVELVDTDELRDAVTSAVSGMVETVAAVDITFYDADGTEVQPLVPIQVTMTNDGGLNEGQPIVVYVDEEGEASVVEQAPTTNSHNEVNFDVVPLTV